MRLITLTQITGSEDMFDGYIETQTESPDMISKTFPVSGFNCVSIFNTYGIEAELTIGSNVQTISLIRDSVKDWWDYWFSPSRIGRDCVFYFPTQPAGVSATLKIKYPAGTAKCGLCVTGVAQELMHTKNGVTVGISDYSRYTTNAFGNTELLPGSWAKRINAELVGRTELFPITSRAIIKNRARACIFDYNQYDSDLTMFHTSQDKFSCLVLYGFTEDFRPSVRSWFVTARHEAQGLI